MAWYIVAVSFIGDGNWGTQRKPPTCRKSLTNFIITRYVITQMTQISPSCKRKDTVIPVCL